MGELNRSEAIQELAQTLEAEIAREFGPVLTGDALRRVLGYPSIDALRQAISRGTVPVPVFELEHRRGKWALARDAAKWLAQARYGVGT